MAYQDRQKAMFIANAVSRLSRDDSWEYLVVLDATLKANKASPLKAPDWQWAFAAMQNARNMGARQRPSPFPSSISYVEKLLDGVGSDNPMLLPLVEWTKDALKEDAGVKQQFLSDTASDSRKRGSVYTQFSPKAVRLLGELYDITQGSEPAEAYWDLHMGRDLGSVKAKPQQIVRENPELQGFLEDLDAGVDDGQRAAAVKHRAAELLTEVTKEPNTIIKGPVQSSALDEYLEQAAETRRQQGAATRRANFEGGLAGAVAIYSFLGGNQHTVRQLNSVLGAVQGIRNAVDAYNGAMAAQGSQAMAGLALAGSWLSVVIAFSSAFSGDQGPDFEAQMKEALTQISQQLRDIQLQIASSVSYIDKRLGQLSQQVQDGFELLFLGLA